MSLPALRMMVSPLLEIPHTSGHPVPIIRPSCCVSMYSIRKKCSYELVRSFHSDWRNWLMGSLQSLFVDVPFHYCLCWPLRRGHDRGRACLDFGVASTAWFAQRGSRLRMFSGKWLSNKPASRSATLDSGLDSREFHAFGTSSYRGTYHGHSGYRWQGGTIWQST